MKPAEKQNILTKWLLWHFSEMPKFLFGVWKNYILFALDYFSLSLLLKSLLSPWRKYRWNYPKWYQVGEFLATFISNVFSRLLGALVRLVLIVVGILFQIFVIIVGLIILLLWMLIPFIIIAGIVFAFYV